MGTTPLEYSTILEDVASHGYVVVGVVSPEFARVSIFADGRIVPGSVPTGKASSRSAAAAAIDAIEASPSIVSNDLRFSLTQLASDSRFKGHVDTTRVGVVGHSIGGAAAEQFAHDDARVRAVFDIDGTSAWSRHNGPLRKPVLVLSAASSTGFNYDRMLDGATPGIHLRIAGTTHSFSSDMGLMPFARDDIPNGAEATPTARGLRITATFIEAFFNQYLNARREVLLSGPSKDYPEITFERGSSR
jgi:dienelactone hydrolase